MNDELDFARGFAEGDARKGRVPDAVLGNAFHDDVLRDPEADAGKKPRFDRARRCLASLCGTGWMIPAAYGAVGYLRSSNVGLAAFLGSQYWLETPDSTYRMTNVDIPMAVLLAAMLYWLSLAVNDRFGVEKVCVLTASACAAVYGAFYASLCTTPFHPVAYWVMRATLWFAVFHDLFAYARLLETRGVLQCRFGPAALVPVLFLPTLVGCAVAGIVYHVAANPSDYVNAFDHETQRLKDVSLCALAVLTLYALAWALARYLSSTRLAVVFETVVIDDEEGRHRLILEDAYADVVGLDTASSQALTEDEENKSAIDSDDLPSIEDHRRRALEKAVPLGSARPAEHGDAMPELERGSDAGTDDDDRPDFVALLKEHLASAKKSFGSGQTCICFFVCATLLASVFQVSRRSMPDWRSVEYQVPTVVFGAASVMGAILVVISLHVGMTRARRRLLSHCVWTVCAVYVVAWMVMEKVMSWNRVPIWVDGDAGPELVARDAFLGSMGLVTGLCLGTAVVECADTEELAEKPDEYRQRAARSENQFAPAVLSFALGVFCQELLNRSICAAYGFADREAEERECYFDYLPWCAFVACCLCLAGIWVPRIVAQFR